ncbi:MAG: hypothetical protein SW833_22095 [Cyanobacteriota bacterium]|nr:hypothetical protein [Cyanobacteriota bacterium]
MKYEADPAVNQYYNIVDFIKANNTPIFYFYPAKCEDDIQQSQWVRELSNVYDFKFSDRNHGCTVLAVSLTDLFNLSHTELMELHRKTRNKLLGRIFFSFRVSGVAKTLSYFAKNKLKKLRTKQSRDVQLNVPTKRAVDLNSGPFSCLRFV